MLEIVEVDEAFMCVDPGEYKSCCALSICRVTVLTWLSTLKEDYWEGSYREVAGCVTLMLAGPTILCSVGAGGGSASWLLCSETNTPS